MMFFSCLLHCGFIYIYIYIYLYIYGLESCFKTTQTKNVMSPDFYCSQYIYNELHSSDESCFKTTQTKNIMSPDFYCFQRQRNLRHARYTLRKEQKIWVWSDTKEILPAWRYFNYFILGKSY